MRSSPASQRVIAATERPPTPFEKTFNYGATFAASSSCTMLLILLSLAIPWTVVQFIRQVSETLEVEYRLSYWTIGFVTKRYGRSTDVVPWSDTTVLPAGSAAAAAQHQTGLIAGLLFSITALLLSCFACICAGRSASSLRGGDKMFGDNTSEPECACGWPAVDETQKYARARCSINAAVILLVLTSAAAAAAATAVSINAGPFIDLVHSYDTLVPGVGIAAFAAVISIWSAINGVIFLSRITIDDFAAVSAVGPHSEIGTVITVNRAHNLAAARL